MSKTSRLLSTSTQRIQEELADVTLGSVPESWSQRRPHLWVDSDHSRATRSRYEGGIVFLDVTFTPERRFKPPEVTFPTRIYRSNINHLGVLCLDLKISGDRHEPFLKSSFLAAQFLQATILATPWWEASPLSIWATEQNVTEWPDSGPRATPRKLAFCNSDIICLPQGELLMISKGREKGGCW